MKKRINERYVEKKVFECDYLFVCDQCGKENNRPYSLFIQTPDHLNKDGNPEFCSIDCMRGWIFSKKAEIKPFNTHDDFDTDDFEKGFSIISLTIEKLRELVREK